MKKLIAFYLAALMLLMSGCTVISSEYSSSEIIYVYDEGNAEVDKIISQIEEDISKREEAGEIIVNVEEEIYVTDGDDGDKDDDTGKQNVVVDGGASSQPVEEIKPADVNTVGEKPLYFTYLTDSQKQIYRYMKTAIEQMTEGFFSIGAVKNGENRFTDIVIAYRALSADNPQYFWLPSNYVMRPDGSAMAFSYQDEGASYPMTAQQKHTAEIQLTTTVNNLVAEANKLSSRYEKELFFHDWLCQNVTYAEDGTDNVYTSYGALVNGVAVCEGYSRAMQLLCDSVGIPCTVIYGSSRDVGHMWNIINPGDGWYHLDVTWDDDEKYNVIRHAYFNLDDQEILQDHKIFDVAEDGKYYIGSDNFNIHLYDCNLKKYNYFVKNNCVFTADYAANAKIVADAARSGKTQLEVYYDGDEHHDFLTQVNIALWQSGSDAWIHDYSYLGNGVVLWW